MRPSIVTLVSYTVRILSLFEVFLHWVKASKLGIKLDFMFFSKKLDISNWNDKEGPGTSSCVFILKR